MEPAERCRCERDLDRCRTSHGVVRSTADSIWIKVKLVTAQLIGPGQQAGASSFCGRHSAFSVVKYGIMNRELDSYSTIGRSGFLRIKTFLLLAGILFAAVGCEEQKRPNTTPAAQAMAPTTTVPAAPQVAAKPEPAPQALTP